jgi:hypothetical protein
LASNWENFMKYVVIAVIAFTAVANNIDPSSRPFVDIAMGALVLWLCFMAGVKMDAWLHRLEHQAPRRGPQTSISYPFLRR